MHTKTNTPPRIVRWLKRRTGPAHGAPVAAFAVPRAATLLPGQRVVVICHSMKAVNRVLAYADLLGVRSAQWKKGNPLPTGVPLVACDFRAAKDRSAFHAELVVFEVYAGGSKQSYQGWRARFQLVEHTVPEIAIYVKSHSLSDETETEEQARADVHAHVMQVLPAQVRDNQDEGVLIGRRNTRGGWGAAPATLVKAAALEVFGSAPLEEKAPLLAMSELNAIQAGTTQRWVEWARGTARMKELVAWIGREIADETVLSELKYGALTNARALRDPRWGAEEQATELHGGEYPRVFAERTNLHMRRVHLMSLLQAAGAGEDVQAARPVLVSRKMGKDIWRAIPWANPGARRDVLQLLRMTVLSEDSDPDAERAERTLTAQRVLTRCGYVSTERMVKVRGERRRWWIPSEQVQPPTPTTPQSESRGLEPLLSTYIGVRAPASETRQKLSFNGHPAQKSSEGATVLLAPGVESAGLGSGGSPKDKERRTRSMKALLDHAVPVAGEPGSLGWKQVTLPGPDQWRPRGVSARLLPDWACNIPNFARGHVYAPAGTLFVNFDFKSCHFRIAERLLTATMPKSTFFTNLFAGGDVYTSIAGDLGLTRDEAKLIALQLLNGAEKSTLEPTLGARAAEVLAAWKKNNPWVGYCRDETTKISNAHNKRSVIACRMQKEEAQLLEATLVELNAQPVQFDVVLPLFDGGLLLCREEDAPALKAAAGRAGKTAAAALGMPAMGMEVGTGPTWWAAQENE